MLVADASEKIPAEWISVIGATTVPPCGSSLSARITYLVLQTLVYVGADISIVAAICQAGGAVARTVRSTFMPLCDLQSAVRARR